VSAKPRKPLGIESETGTATNMNRSATADEDDHSRLYL